MEKREDLSGSDSGSDDGEFFDAAEFQSFEDWMQMEMVRVMSTHKGKRRGWREDSGLKLDFESLELEEVWNLGF